MAGEPETASLEFDRKLREYCRHLGRSTVAFIWPTSEPVPETGGIGVLLHVPPDSYFALTAAHVAEELLRCHHEHKTPFICGACGVEVQPIPVDDVRIVSSHLGVREGNIDLLDTAAIKLSGRMVERLLVHNRFLTLNDVDLSVEGGDESCFYVLGYAIKGQPAPDFERMVITRDPFHFCTHLAREEARQLVVYDEYIGLALAFGPQIRRGPTGELEDVPDLNGISGCGIWRLGPISKPFTEWQPEDAKLVGLEHKVISSPSVMVGTQIKCILQLLLNEYPALADAIRSAFRLG
jgi:hypothetical protein